MRLLGKTPVQWAGIVLVCGALINCQSLLLGQDANFLSVDQAKEKLFEFVRQMDSSLQKEDFHKQLGTPQEKTSRVDGAYLEFNTSIGTFAISREGIVTEASLEKARGVQVDENLLLEKQEDGGMGMTSNQGKLAAAIKDKATLSLKQAEERALAFLGVVYRGFTQRSFDIESSLAISGTDVVYYISELREVARPKDGVTAVFPNRIIVRTNPQDGSIWGYLASDLRIELKDKPKVRESDAKKIALEFIGEGKRRKIKVGEVLLMAKPKLDRRSGDLAWSIEILVESEDENFMKTVFVSAVNGKILPSD